MTDSGIELIGFWAALLTTIAFAPQVIRTWRLGGHELSWSMLALFGAGVTLWFAYGYLRQSMPLLVANGLTLLQVVLMTVIKFNASRRLPRRNDRTG